MAHPPPPLADRQPRACTALAKERTRLAQRPPAHTYRVPLQRLLDSLASHALVRAVVEAVGAVAPVAVPAARKALAVELEAARVLAVARLLLRRALVVCASPAAVAPLRRLCAGGRAREQRLHRDARRCRRRARRRGHLGLRRGRHGRRGQRERRRHRSRARGGGAQAARAPRLCGRRVGAIVGSARAPRRGRRAQRRTPRPGRAARGFDRGSRAPRRGGSAGRRRRGRAAGLKGKASLRPLLRRLHPVVGRARHGARAPASQQPPTGRLARANQTRPRGRHGRLAQVGRPTAPSPPKQAPFQPG